MSELRRTGRTTRLIDKAIQDFFTKGKAVLVDHHSSHDSNMYLLRRFLKRLVDEHNLEARYDFEINYADFEIKRVKSLING